MSGEDAGAVSDAVRPDAAREAHEAGASASPSIRESDDGRRPTQPAAAEVASQDQQPVQAKSIVMSPDQKDSPETLPWFGAVTPAPALAGELDRSDASGIRSKAASAAAIVARGAGNAVLGVGSTALKKVFGASREAVQSAVQQSVQPVVLQQPSETAPVPSAPPEALPQLSTGVSHDLAERQEEVAYVESQEL